MKHLLNDLSEEEKNRIREQHTGGKKLVIENFDKLVNTKLGDAKPLLNEEDAVKKECDPNTYMLPQGTTLVGASEVIKYLKNPKHSSVAAMKRCVNGKLETCGCRITNEELDCFKE